MALRKALIAVCAMTCTLMGAAKAATVTIDGTDYIASTITGTYTDNKALLGSQPIFTATQQNAIDAAQQIQGDLGLPNFILQRFATPLYAYNSDETPGFVSVYFLIQFPDLSGALFTDLIGQDEVWTYAVFEPVNPVPLPAAAPFFLAGLAGFGWLRRKAKA